MVFWCLYCDVIFNNLDQTFRGYAMVGGLFAESRIGQTGIYLLNFTWGQSNHFDALGACIVILVIGMGRMD